MTQTNKPRQAPAEGETIKYMGRELSLTEHGQILSKMKGRDDIVHPNMSRALDSIGLATGLSF